MISSMTTARFFCDTRLEHCDTIELPDDVAHHVRVRRLREGEPIVLFDGKGRQAEARISVISKSLCQAKIESSSLVSREISGKITLVQAMASQDKMDWIIEKATELGVTRMIAVQASRSVVKLNSDRASKRAAHGRRLIESASEQCGRNHLMQLLMPHSLKQAIEACKDQPMLACVLSEAALPLTSESLLETVRRHQGCSVFIGPEGGWAPDEQNELIKAGAVAISLGRRVLRTETAGLAAVSALTALQRWDHPETVQ
ncbi:16S rRNA (uracil(1498)-N(3))-methyltransferase [Orrella marina]|uniref:Ribosomal RNA small subunit methyltransferase E n=2 Tax=Orrella marina TaxID=2163011 RepID=A0A2R4XIN6_9BURK|nr:16S rRNA (uracil(1498)-N(3))-methyltransferase [Orrella marina]